MRIIIDYPWNQKWEELVILYTPLERFITVDDRVMRSCYNQILEIQILYFITLLIG